MELLLLKLKELLQDRNGFFYTKMRSYKNLIFIVLFLMSCTIPVSFSQYGMKTNIGKLQKRIDKYELNEFSHLYMDSVSLDKYFTGIYTPSGQVAFNNILIIDSMGLVYFNEYSEGCNYDYSSLTLQDDNPYDLQSRRMRFSDLNFFSLTTQEQIKLDFEENRNIVLVTWSKLAGAYNKTESKKFAQAIKKEHACEDCLYYYLNLDFVENEIE